MIKRISNADGIRYIVTAKEKKYIQALEKAKADMGSVVYMDDEVNTRTGINCGGFIFNDDILGGIIAIVDRVNNTIYLTNSITDAYIEYKKLANGSK